VFFLSQGVPVAVLCHLALLNRQVAPSPTGGDVSSSPTVEWYPPGRIVAAATLMAGTFAFVSLVALSPDLEQLRALLRELIEKVFLKQLPIFQDRVLSESEISTLVEVALYTLPAATALSWFGGFLLNLWLAGRITLASGRLVRPWPDLAAMTFPPGFALGLEFLSRLCRLPGLRVRWRPVLRLPDDGPGDRALRHAWHAGTAVRAVGRLREPVHPQYVGRARIGTGWHRGTSVAPATAPQPWPTGSRLAAGSPPATDPLQTNQETKTMQVILLERIGRLGQMGDIVRVKDGFARNFLLPNGKALRATPENRQRFDKERVHLEARNLELKTEAEAVAVKLEGKSFVTIRQAGDTGQLYGSVSTRDIAEAMMRDGFTIERRQVLLDRPIKTLGVHELRIGLHPEVAVKVMVNVARSDEEAERQSRGEDVAVVRDERPEREILEAEAEAMFEPGRGGDEEGPAAKVE
jgi:large subunit ribosomal protein L9